MSRDLGNFGRPVRLAPLDLLGLGMLGIRTRKMRAALSALGIAIGIATMVVVTGIPASSQKALNAELAKLGPNVLVASANSAGNDRASFPPESVAMTARISPVLVASAVANTHAGISRSDLNASEEFSGVTVLASKTNLLTAINGHLQSGRFLDAAMERQPAVVLGSVAAARLGVERITPGSPAPQVYTGKRWFTVIGVLQPTPLTPDIDRSALVGWEAARSQLKFNGRPTVIYLKAQEDQVEAVRAVLPATVSPQAPGVALISKPSDALAAKRATETAFSSLLLGLAGVALLVGGIGVANTMVISVLERRREIGLRRALGANRGQIRGQFLTESVVLSALGGVAGVLLGVATTAGYAAYQHWPVVLPADAVVSGLGGAVVVGMIAGVYPSIRASRLTPTEALATV
jgi:putative ABC transport system permease protein